MALALGLFLPQASELASMLVLPALAVALAVTLLRFPAGYLKKPGDLLAGTLWGILMNYLLLGNLILLGGLFLIRDEKFWEGMVLLAAVPPSALVLSLGEKIKSARGLILAGFAGTYAGALILIPLIGIAFLKFFPVHYDRLFILPFGLIVLPLLISRFLVDQDLDEWVNKHEKLITGICLFIVFYALTAGNAELIRQWPDDPHARLVRKLVELAMEPLVSTKAQEPLQRLARCSEPACRRFFLRSVKQGPRRKHCSKRCQRKGEYIPSQDGAILPK